MEQEVLTITYWTKYHKNGDEVSNGWVCSNCDKRNYLPTPYCPYCGEKVKSKIQGPKETSVDAFIEASCWEDWINQYTEDVYTIYWQWCIKEGLEPEKKVTFMRRVLNECPELKSVPYKGKRRFRRNDNAL